MFILIQFSEMHGVGRVNSELFYRSIYNIKILSGNNLDFIKTKIKDTVLTSFRNYNINVLQYLSSEEVEALKTVI